MFRKRPVQLVRPPVMRRAGHAYMDMHMAHGTLGMRVSSRGLYSVRRRRLTLFPSGNNTGSEKTPSLYLAVAGVPALWLGWARKVHLTLTVHDQLVPRKSVSFSTAAVLDAERVDYGFRKILGTDATHVLQGGFVVDDKVMISTKFRVNLSGGDDGDCSGDNDGGGGRGASDGD